jgi:hypothetical protein
MQKVEEKGRTRRRYEQERGGEGEDGEKRVGEKEAN